MSSGKILTISIWHVVCNNHAADGFIKVCLIALAGRKMVFLSHFQAFHAILATFNYGQKENKATQKYVCEIVYTSA